LKADLVFDESKLNTERIRVVWLSPNDWDNAGGFRYGNVRFRYDWAKLVEGKKYYWVEVMKYNPHACRILVTDQDRSGQLQPYDPTVTNGPWRRTASGDHLWNGNYTLEVMFEQDLMVHDAEAVDFVVHHHSMCNANLSTCRYPGVDRWEAGQEFVARVASRMGSLQLPGFVDGGKPTLALQAPVDRLLIKCNKMKVAWGLAKASDASAPALARAFLNAFHSSSMKEDRHAIAAQFESARELEHAVAAVIAEAAGLSDSSSLVVEDDHPF
jgi:hypothetical protein